MSARSRLHLIAALAVAGLLAGCATGPKYTEVASAIPTLKPAEGRIYFYRTSALGAAVQPTINLNGTAVGTSITSGFFFVDRPPGSYEVMMGTEVERKLTFTLEAGQERFVRTSISLGLLVGRPHAELVDAKEAREEISTLSYTGTPLQKK